MHTKTLNAQLDIKLKYVEKKTKKYVEIYFKWVQINLVVWV